MDVYQRAAWSLIFGLSLMLVGGLVLWTYGTGRRKPPVPALLMGLEAEATQHFHLRLSRWFFIYGISLIVMGVGLLLRAGAIFL